MKDFQEDGCIYCHEKQQTTYFFNCCLRLSCSNCHLNNQYIQCQQRQSKQTINSQNQQENIIKLKCDRCLMIKKEQQIYCCNCNATFCKKCLDQTHNKGKFLAHQHLIKKYPMQELLCSKHHKRKNIFTEQGKIICQHCFNQNKDKKGKNITNVNSQLIKNCIKTIESGLGNLLQSENQKFKRLKQSLEKQYETIKQKICQKMRNTFISIQKFHQKFKSNVEGLYQKINLIQNQFQLIEKKKSNSNYVNKMQTLLQFRSFFLNEQINKLRKQTQKIQLYEYKFTPPSFQEIQTFLKSFIIQKTKIKNNDDQKENKSLRKSRVSSKKLSFREDHKSQTKSIKNNDRSIASKYNTINTIDKQYKCKQNSQEFIPKLLVKLNYNCPGSMTNLIDNKKGEQDHSIVSPNDRIKTTYMKRKADFLDMRDRMRKPSIINRFQKR